VNVVLLEVNAMQLMENCDLNSVAYKLFSLHFALEYIVMTITTSLCNMITGISSNFSD